MKIRSLLVLVPAILALAIVATATAAPPSAEQRDSVHVDHPGHDFSWDGDTLVLRADADSGETVRMTPEGSLTVNGRAVSLGGSDRGLVQDFYGQYLAIEEDAAVIGAEGAKIGAAGAALGVEALARVIRLTRDDYAQADLERELRARAVLVEARGAALGERAKAVEKLADELGRTAGELRARIPALRRLDWFRFDRDDVEGAQDEE